MSKIFWCTTCLNMSTRPRISFDNDGRCNACVWYDKKKEINWDERNNLLKKILEDSKNISPSGYDCVIPCSGGKDGSYVSYKIKHDYNMNPLCVTIRPDLELELGKKNLNAFVNSGYDHIHFTPNAKAMRTLNTIGFIEKGFPYYGWLLAIQASVIRIAHQFKIPLIFYGEDGEVEYGGSDESIEKPFFDISYMKRVYSEGGYEKVMNLAKKQGLTEKELYFWKWVEDENESSNLKLTHWSFFEKWDSYRNYIVAKENCGLIEKEESNEGTFTNFAQNDQAFYPLHTYLMYLKFGFGRATQDAGIEIRRGSMTRNQAINLVKVYDNQLPNEYINLYLDYYKMSREEFDNVLEKHVNKDLFKKINGIWSPMFVVGEGLNE